MTHEHHHPDHDCAHSAHDCAVHAASSAVHSGHSTHSHSGHDHGAHCHTGNANSTRLAWALLVIGVFAVVEVVGGLISGSLALLADAGHMVTDGIAIAIALWAKMLAKQPSSDAMPYGRKRAQVLAAFVNGAALFVLIGILLVESGQRFTNPTEIDAMTMMGIAVIGLGANILAFFILHTGDTEDINMRGAVLHVVGDMLGSVAAIISAIVIATKGWLVVDPLVTVLVCLLIGRSAWSLTAEAMHVLLQGAPKGLDVPLLQKSLKNEVKAIENIHDLRVWMLTPDSKQLTMHVCVATNNDVNDTLAQIKRYLENTHNIADSIIQIETTEQCTADKVAGETISEGVETSNDTASNNPADDGTGISDLGSPSVAEVLDRPIKPSLCPDRIVSPSIRDENRSDSDYKRQKITSKSKAAITPY